MTPPNTLRGYMESDAVPLQMPKYEGNAVTQLADGWRTNERNNMDRFVADDLPLQDASLDFLPIPAARAVKMNKRLNAPLVDEKTLRAGGLDYYANKLKGNKGYADETGMYVKRNLNDPAGYGTVVHEGSHFGRDMDGKLLEYVSPKKDKSNFYEYFSSPEEYAARLDGYRGDMFMQETLQKSGIRNKEVDAQIMDFYQYTENAMMYPRNNRQPFIHTDHPFYKEANDIMMEYGEKLKGNRTPKPPTMLEQVESINLLDRF